MRRAAFFVIIGMGGAAILIWLGTWQMQRLAWKQSVIADINARIVADPVMLPDGPDPERDAYLPVRLQGMLGSDQIHVLVSGKDIGAGYRVISALTTDTGRRILVDLGFVPAPQKDTVDVVGTAELTGNLQWPQETDGFTPEPDLKNNIWFARDVPAMAASLNTDPVMLVTRSGVLQSKAVSPMPVDTARIPNDHLQYAITWFSLAAIWLAMSIAFLRRNAPSAKG